MVGKHAYVIAVANQKGGVAKTTTVVSLGGALAYKNQEILLVDLDIQGNLTLALGNDPGKVCSSIADVFFNSATLLSVSRETAVPGLDIVPSNNEMEFAERFLPSRHNYEFILRNSIIGVDTKLRGYAVEGLPITHYKSQSRSAFQYAALAKELIQYVQENTSTSA